MIKGYMLIKTVPGREYDVAMKIKEIDNVADATVTYGLWDIVVEILAPNMAEFDRTIMSIRSIGGIEQTTTLISHES